MNRLPYFCILFVACLALAFACFACGSSSSNTGTATTPQPTATHQAQATATPKHFKPGQTVNVGNTWQLVVLSARNGGTASYLKPGQVFLEITVKAVNISKDEQTMSSLGNWSVRDSDGNTYQAGYDQSAGPTLDGKVEAGSPLKGSLTFVVSGKVKQYLLLFQSNVFEQGQVLWDITV